VFEFLDGELARKTPTEAVVDVNGVGYLLSISLQCFTALPERGRVKLLVHVHTTESGSRLVGFIDERERSMFRLLQSVGGIGPNVALALLSHEMPAALAARIRAGDVKGLTRIKGIGTKTAERLVLELKDKVVAEPGAIAVADQEQLLVQALESLGLDPADATARAKAAAKALPKEERVEVLLRHALRARAAGK
jgi:Holliday junction DNA helicase RuvA